MNHKLFDLEDCEEYAAEFSGDIKFVKVNWEQDSACWLVSTEQLKGHEFHYSYPQSGQYLPYNIIIKDGREMPHPRALFTDYRLPRTTLT